MVKAHNSSRPVAQKIPRKHPGLIPSNAMLKPAANQRGREASAATHSQPRPSELFDWDKALLLHALAMWDLGYPLSADQKRRIENSAKD